ncbi:serpentine type 7TM GPCR chemoreceptor srt domain-containing protein [Ditylenchus destructor]|nr:serpentine type 7TM GPCR chemoreceptor srt domain-containing protein [Ditylenchus destructor]
MMNVLLLYPKEYQRLYNCTFYKVDDVPFEHRQHLFTGIALISLFVFFEVLYIPCVFTLYKLTSQSTYKTMFVIGLTDLVGLFVIGFLSGYFSLVGAVFCSHPNFIYITGCLLAICWGNASMSSTLLAFSRCVGIWKPSLAKILFDGNRTWFWHLIIFGYVLYYSLLNTPLLYTSMETAWIYNPHHGYLEGVNDLYGSVVEIYHDIFVIIVILSLYIGFLIVLGKKKSTQKVTASVLMVKPVHYSDKSERKGHSSQKNV